MLRVASKCSGIVLIGTALHRNGKVLECKESQWHGLVGDARDWQSLTMNGQGKAEQRKGMAQPVVEPQRRRNEAICDGAVWLSYAKDMLRFAGMRVGGASNSSAKKSLGMAAFSGA